MTQRSRKPDHFHGQPHSKGVPSRQSPATPTSRSYAAFPASTDLILCATCICNLRGSNAVPSAAGYLSNDHGYRRLCVASLCSLTVQPGSPSPGEAENCGRPSSYTLPLLPFGRPPLSRALCVLRVSSARDQFVLRGVGCVSCWGELNRVRLRRRVLPKNRRANLEQLFGRSGPTSRRSSCRRKSAALSARHSSTSTANASLRRVPSWSFSANCWIELVTRWRNPQRPEGEPIEADGCAWDRLPPAIEFSSRGGVEGHAALRSMGPPEPRGRGVSPADAAGIKPGPRDNHTRRAA